MLRFSILPASRLFAGIIATINMDDITNRQQAIAERVRDGL